MKGKAEKKKFAYVQRSEDQRTRTFWIARQCVRGKVIGPSRITTEMFKKSGGVGYGIVTNIVNQGVHKGIIPNDWFRSRLLQK